MKARRCCAASAAWSWTPVSGAEADDEEEEDAAPGAGWWWDEAVEASAPLEPAV
jgi:hypothetical protein